MTRREIDALTLELFAGRFASIVREMGATLQRTAVSTNVKERLDYSCALIDDRGQLVMHAPHIPVHLGSMGLCVRTMRERTRLDPGDVVVTNHPALGGSHLPDVSVVAPVFGEDGSLLGYVANRAHHAEIGGMSPGSMPSRATRLVDEGVVIPPTHVVRDGRARWRELERCLGEGPFPSRAVSDNLADIRAAVAANHHGAIALRTLARRHGADGVRGSMRALTELAALRMRSTLARLGDGEMQARETLDDGTPLAVRIAMRSGEATIDFTGSGGVHSGNLNATPAITRSVVLYVLRVLAGSEPDRGEQAGPLPLNEGLLDPVQLVIPDGILSPAFPDDPALAPAVVGGNVETSQRLVDTLLRALGLAACSQGTMNNVLFGTEQFAYYETICGGCGAGDGFDGADAVHSHMTNTRITDAEVIERRYPVRVERFAIRRGSGGSGRFRGGDGVVREIRFLAPMTISVLGQHRVQRPYGMHGGEPGACGRQRVMRASGEEQELDSIDGCEVAPGDRLIIETPGGGGWEEGTG